MFACPTPASFGPATPPPDFDLDLAITSLRKFVDRSPAEVALAHYGLVPDPIDTLQEAEGILRQWAEVAEAAFREGRDIAEALDARVQRAAAAAPTRSTGPSSRR